MAWISGNYRLSMAEMQNNAEIVQGYGVAQGWSPNAICAILGNMQQESSINPGIYGDYINGTPHAYGLVQWNPIEKYSNWAGAGWQDNGTREMERISWEAANNEQWSSSAPYTFTQFLYDRVSGIDTLTRYFCWYYERPDPAQANIAGRIQYANYWATYLDWDDPPHPPPPDPPSPDPPEPPDPGPDPPGPGPTPTFPYWILFKFRGRGQIWL